MLEVIFEVVLKGIFELLLRLPGYLVLRCFRKEGEVEFDTRQTIVLSVLFWLLAVGVVLLIVWLR